MSKTLLVETNNEEFRITIPDDSRVTFGPWSPPSQKSGGYPNGGATGTLRVYRNKDDIIFCQSGVISYRDLSAVQVAKKVATEEVSTVWKSDSGGYSRETTGTINAEWIEDDIPALPNARRRKR